MPATGDDEKSRRVNATTAVGGAILTILGLYLGWSAFPMLVRYRVKQTMMLEEGSDNMEAWLRLPTPLEFKVYMYNVTNPGQVQQGQRPVLREIGPYVYDEFIERVEVEEGGEGDDTLSYMSRSTYIFNPGKSGSLRPQDVLTILNVPLVGTALMVEELFPVGLAYVNSAVDKLFANTSRSEAAAPPPPGLLFIAASVHDLLFGGVLVNCSAEAGPAATVCRGLASRAPVTLTPIQGTPHFKFAFFRHKNNSLEGRYRIDRGREDISRLGEIVSYRNRSTLATWAKNSSCNRILGTDSTIFPPFVRKDQRIYIFITDVCSSVYAEYDSDGYERGLPVLRFTGSPDNFADAAHHPENRCRCRRQQLQDCLKTGVIDATNCHGAPVIFSMPHLYMADAEYAGYALGLAPDKAKHETFVLLEPYTSVPVEGRKRLQLNMFLKKLPTIDVMANVSQGLFPILWIEEGAALDEGSLGKLRKIYTVILVQDILTWLLMAVGVVCLVTAAALYLNVGRLVLGLVRANRVSDVPAAEGGRRGKQTVFTLAAADPPPPGGAPMPSLASGGVQHPLAPLSTSGQ